MSEFVHLHVHSQYSFLVSTVKLSELPKRVRERGMNAVALTDLGNMFGAVKHWKECKAAGVTPLLGCELAVSRAPGAHADHLLVLSASDQGYKNLIKLVSMGYSSATPQAVPTVTLAEVAERAKGLVALSGCLGGVLPQSICHHGEEGGKKTLGELADVFEKGSLFVELQDHGLPEQPVLNDLLGKAAKAAGVPVVATNNVQFMDQADGEAQLYLECVRLNRRYEDARRYHHGRFEMYLKTPAEMAAVFGEGSDALKNTLRIAEMCSGFQLSLGKPMLPHFLVPEGYDVDSYLRHVARQGLAQKLVEIAATGRKVDEEAYRKRLETELDVIVGMKFPGYFLIVWDFIREAKARKIPVGPGRGSGAGSLVAFALDITSIDPIPYNLLFERFLNPERVSMPDFDIDFCMSRRDEVIKYVAEKYGTTSVGQIATFQNLKARSVIKDVARAMGIAPPDAQRIASLVPEKGQGKMCTIDEALEVEPKLKERVASDPQVKVLIDQARKLEGLTRHAGMHAAGVVISEGPLDTHVPCFTNAETIVTQYDKDDVEAAGLVKFDFLGLKTLTVIDIAEKLVNARPDRKDKPLDVNRISLEDRHTYALISSGDTTGVFQLESSGMQQLLRGLKPDCFEDIIAAVALYRPGPLGTGMIDDFIGGKHGKKAIRKLHDLVDPVLAPTYGVPVYQEQVMQIAQYLSGYTLGGADLLRRAMGKKKAEEMAKQQATFVAGAEKNGVSPEQAAAIFKEVEGFASYGFNKSHSAAYALVTYQTAYLKAHYPTEFFAALLTADKDKIDKVVRTIAEARAWGVTVLPPDVNASAIDFSVVYASPKGDGPPRGPGRLADRYRPQIRFGLGAVRGLGEAALETVLEAREAGGPFADLFDFAGRVDAKRLNKGVLEALVQCGAFDSTLATMGISRARAYAAVDRALERSRSASRDRERGQTSLFGLFDAAAATNGETGKRGGGLDEYPQAAPWDRLSLLSREKQALGCYVSGHPLHRYGDKIARLGVPAIKVAEQEAWSVVTVAGMVENYQEKLFKGGSGGKAAFFEIEDMSGRVKAKVRNERIETYGPLLASGEAVLVTGKVSFPITDEPDAEAEPTLLVDEVVPLSDAVRRSTRAILIHLDATETGPEQLESLKSLLADSPGACPVDLVLALPEGARAVLTIEGARVDPSDTMLSGLERLFGGTVTELR
ncbi:MAG TPA: DNA polymerase III subunit alpha [Polyangiaceae bacterium]|nr:DNA polymerase III subunit alpha [Polyangiaceae bacterium]